MTTLFPPSSPTLPEFRTLLVDGNYHPSAPIHLCVSHLAQSDGKQAILLYPSRAKFTSALKESNDGWLNQHGGEGAFSQHTRNVQVLYPPTTVHLTFLLSMLHKAQKSDKDDFIRKTTFAATPSLIMLCEPSAYLSGNPDATIASYLSLLSHAFSCVSSLSQTPNTSVSLAVFDSGLTNLKLPILPPLHMEELEKQGEREAKEKQIEYQPDTTPKSIPIPFLAYKYFELVGTFEDDHENNHSTSRSRIFKLVRPDSGTEELSWKWRERRDQEPDGVAFTWT
ncbi:hypothetical protein QCA50_000102 [Cerrena zonata]|uniref:Elongator complex protein 5 n=1 Tax=Cerrena zonata TaxID=2478898 RepID=A0AAW0GPQ2_9APHY